jgi:hypothetical protein
MWKIIAVTSSLVAGCGSGANLPAAPTELKVEYLGGGGHCTWKDNSDNESQFMIERKPMVGAFAIVGTVPFNTVLYHDAPVTSGMTYVYRIMAMPMQSGHGGEHVGSYSNEATLTVP